MDDAIETLEIERDILIHNRDVTITDVAQAEQNQLRGRRIEQINEALQKLAASC